MRWKLVPRNAAANAERPRAPRPVPKAWDAGQIAAFLRLVEGDRLEALWRFLTVTGCRRGGAAGLRWQDVDLKRGLATITNQRTLATGQVVEGPVKTSSGARTVALDPGTVALLRSWRRAQLAEFLHLGVRPDAAYVFTGEGGLPLWPQWITARFRELCAFSSLNLLISPDRDGYEGRGHSLWYCDAQEAGRYQWFETAFMLPGIKLAITRQEPFALNPGADAFQAFEAWPNKAQVAWPLTPVNVGDLGELIGRWAEWFADASEGRLSRLQRMPERSPQGSCDRFEKLLHAGSRCLEDAAQVSGTVAHLCK